MKLIRKHQGNLALAQILQDSLITVQGSFEEQTAKLSEQIQNLTGYISPFEFEFSPHECADLALTAPDIFALPPNLAPIALKASQKVIITSNKDSDNIERAKEAEKMKKLSEMGYLRRFRIGKQLFFTTLSILELQRIGTLSPYEREIALVVMKRQNIMPEEIIKDLVDLELVPPRREEFSKILGSLIQKSWIRKTADGAIRYCRLDGLV